MKTLVIAMVVTKAMVGIMQYNVGYDVSSDCMLVWKVLVVAMIVMKVLVITMMVMKVLVNKILVMMTLVIAMMTLRLWWSLCW